MRRRRKRSSADSGKDRHSAMPTSSAGSRWCQLGKSRNRRAQFEIGRLASKPVTVATSTEGVAGLFTCVPALQAPSIWLKPLYVTKGTFRAVKRSHSSELSPSPSAWSTTAAERPGCSTARFHGLSAMAQGLCSARQSQTPLRPADPLVALRCRFGFCSRFSS